MADLWRPDRDGCRLLRQIDALNDPADKILAIATAGDVRPERRQAALAAGFQPVLGKRLIHRTAPPRGPSGEERWGSVVGSVITVRTIFRVRSNAVVNGSWSDTGT